MSREALELHEETEVVHIDQGAIGAIVKSEVEAQLDAAHRYPRQLKRFLNEAITLATFSVEIAESCMYSLPRAGKTITGPSIRLAEMMASAYGNLHIGARVVGVEDKEIVAQGVSWDLEKNVRVTIEKRRRITKKDGRRFDEDMITVTGNAAASIGLRDAIFRVIPRAYVNVVYDAARKVAVGDASTLVDKRQAVWERLQKMGAFPARILAKIGKASMEDIGLTELETLIGFGVAIKDGGISVDEAFPPIENISAANGKSAIDRIVQQEADKKKPASPGAIVLISKAQRDQLQAAIQQQWTDSAELPALLKTAAPYVDVDVTVAGIPEILVQIGENDFGKALELLAAGPAKWRDMAKTPEELAESVISQEEYDNLWSFMTETKARQSKVMAFIKELGYAKASGIRKKDYAKVFEFAKKQE